jgi:DNA-binding CsgD family transcriptional regulator
MTVESPPEPGPTLVGRQVELDRVNALLDDLRRRGGALVISGEPGIGKSALLDFAKQRAGDLGARILGAVGAESEAPLSFAALHQLLRPLSKRMESLPDPQRQALRAAFGITHETEPDRFRVALAAFQLVSDAADASPLLLTVDDAQWIDRSSLDALAFIARRLDDEPVAMLVAVRDGFALTEALHLPIAHLERLDDSAAEELLDRNAPDITGSLRARVVREAAGNPLGLVEFARVAPTNELRERPSLAPLTLTARLERAFAATFNGLPEPARLVLLAGALDPRASLEEVLQAATRINGGGRIDLTALDSAIATGYVAVVDARLRFSHPLVRSAVRQTATPAQVLEMFAALAQVVGDPDRQLWHRAMSTVGHDEELAAALDAFARAARRRGALMVAANALERAADLSVEPRKRAERRVRAAEFAYELGDVETVRSLARQVEAVDVATLEAARLQWLYQMVGGDVWFETGAAKTFVTIADQMRSGGDPDMALRSLIPIALRCWWTHPRTETREYLVAAAERVEVAQDDSRRLAVIALAHPEACGPAVLKRIAGIKLHDVPEPIAAMYVGLAAGAAGDWGTGLSFLARAVDRLRDEGRLGLLTQALVHYAFAATNCGDWQAALAAGQEAGRLARDSRQPQFGLTGELIAALVTGLSGADADLEALLVGPERAVLAARSEPLLATARLARGAAALGDGRHEDAFQHLWPVFDEHDQAFHRFMRWWAILDLVEAGRRGPHARDVQRAVADLETIAQRSKPPILCVGLTCAMPLMAADEEVEPLFKAALEQDLTSHPFLRARTLLSYGAWLRRQRRRVDSRRPLRDAREHFDALGATQWSERARHELRATGETIARRAPDARDRLTAQELQIARLAAEGLSNREIGERLFLSHRTIGSHLYRIFPKLEISARAQLRAALEPLAKTD